jgi:hypothetical protein
MNDKIVENQKAITVALQDALLSALSSGKPFRCYLESVRFSVEITERLTSESRSEFMPTINRCDPY